MSISRDQHRRKAVWDISSGPRNYAILVATQTASSLASLTCVWLLTRFLGADGYGNVTAIIAAVMLVSAIALNWSAIALARIGCEEFVNTGRITETFWTRSYIFLANWGLVILTAPFWLRPVAFWLHLTHEAQIMLFVYLAAFSLWGHVQYALQGVKLQDLTGKLFATERLIILIGAIFLAALGISLWKVITVYAIGAMLAAAFGLWRLRHLVGAPVSPSPVLLRRLLLFSLPLIPQSLVSYFSTSYLDAWFILRYLSAADLGVYAIAYQLTGTMMQLPVLASSLLLPLFTTLEVEQDDGRVAGYLYYILPVLSLVWTVAGTLLAGLCGVLLPIFFGQQFVAASGLMWPLLAACSIAGPMSMGYGPLLNAKSATTALAMSAIAGALTNVLLNLLLIPRWGLLGCAWATVGAYWVSLTIAAYLLWRVCRFKSGWTIEAIAPLLGGAAFAGITGNSLMAFLLTFGLILCLAFFRRKSLLIGMKRLGGLWVRKSELVFQPER